MNQNPIRKVLLTMQKHDVQCLLMGGQACVFYGGAEFSRNTDLALLAEAGNLARLQAALTELCADVIAVPPYRMEYLQRGHAIHFRCRHPEAVGMRVDVMSRMRGLPGFDVLWSRRTTVEVAEGERYDLLSLPDLVQAKKTQRDKDWPMIRRLVEAHYARHGDEAADPALRFWFLEARTPELLRHLAQAYPDALDRVRPQRALLAGLPEADVVAVHAALAAEEATEREADREYWEPLRRELEALRRKGRAARD